jgi:hypothetical protein
MCSDGSLLQKNQGKIIVPLTHEGIALDARNLISATYKLYSLNKKQVLLEKSIGNGIETDGPILVINLDDEDSKNLTGTYYHELTIVDGVLGRRTAFQKDIRFKATRN